MPFILWIHAKPPLKARATSAWHVPEKQLYTTTIKRALASSGVVPARFRLELHDHSSPNQWQSAFEHLDSHVVGLCLVDASRIPDPYAYLTGPERQLSDYWKNTLYGTLPLVFYTILDAKPLSVPVRVHEAYGREGKSGMFFKLTQASWERLRNTPLALTNGQSNRVDDLIATWTAAHNVNLANRDHVMIALNAVVPHAVLLVSGVWKCYAFPLPPFRNRNALGFSLVRWLIDPLDRDVAAMEQFRELEVAMVDRDNFSMDHIQDISDQLRYQLTRTHELGEHDRLILKGHILRLQAIRDNLVASSHQLCRRSYNVSILVSSMLLAGYLKDSSHLRESLDFAIRIVIGDDSMAKYFSDQLKQDHAVPGRSTLHRHRLSVHIALCRWVQDVNAAMMTEPVVAWRTMDGSPQGGYDLIITGCTVMRASELIDALKIAWALCATDGEEISSEDEKAYVAQLSPLLRITQGVPASVGSGRSSMRHKMHATCHSERLQQPDWEHVARSINSTFSWTADLGEVTLTEFKHNLVHLFGPWVMPGAHRPAPDPDAFEFHDGRGEMDTNTFDGSFGFVDGSHAPDDVPDGDGGIDSFAIDNTKAIFIAGILHCVHNCTKDFGKGFLEYYDVFVERLTHVCRLMSRRWSKQRLLATCFSTLPQSTYYGEFAKFNWVVYPGRWGSILRAIVAILPLKVPLRFAWSYPAYNFNAPAMNRDGDGGGGNDEEDERAQNAVKAGIANDAIVSNLFWAYLQMLSLVGAVLLHVSSWAEGCACHREAFSTNAQTYFSRGEQFKKKTGCLHCPMCTRLAPECAAGELFEMLEMLFGTVLATLLMDSSMQGLSELERGLVMRDFVALRRHVFTYLRIKMSFWRQLPWVLLGIAHPNRQKAVECARRALALSQLVTARVHWLVASMCTAGSICYQQLVLFISGADLLSLPTLALWAAKFRFVAIAERWIEGRHAIIKQLLAGLHAASMQHIAFAGALPTLHKMITDHPRGLDTFAEYFAQTRHPVFALKAVARPVSRVLV